MEIGAIMSSLAAHMVLPVGDAKPSWDSAASTISISDFGHNLSEPVTSRAMRNSRVFWSGLFVIQGPKTKLYINCLKMFCVSAYERSFMWHEEFWHSTASALFVLQQKDSKYRDCLYLSLAQWRGAIDRRRSRWGLTELLGRKLSEGDWRGLWRHSNASNDGEINESIQCTTSDIIQGNHSNFHISVNYLFFLVVDPEIKPNPGGFSEFPIFRSINYCVMGIGPKAIPPYLIL